MNTINIAKDFTDSPGTRYKNKGDFTGEEFREKFLVPVVESNTPTLVILDGLMGSPTSFFEEAFGGLARIYGPERVRKLFEFQSLEEPLLIEEIHNYITEANLKK